MRYLLTLLCFSQIATAAPLQVVTFNMKWFGLGGGIAGNFGDEFRDSWIFEFSATPMGGGFLQADVLVLEEVVEPSRLKRLVPNHVCHSYITTSFRHQHVVVCVRQGLTFEPDGGDDNYALESVSMGGDLRPAVHGTVVETATGTKRFHLIGVHLKADRDESAKRLEQMKLIKAFMDNNINDGLPIVMTGDFNLFDENGDLAQMEALLAGTVKAVPSTRTTYRGFSRARQFDLFFVSPSMLPMGSPYVPDICQADHQGRVRFDNLEFYRQMVSDHCPVKITVN